MTTFLAEAIRRISHHAIAVANDIKTSRDFPPSDLDLWIDWIRLHNGIKKDNCLLTIQKLWTTQEKYTPFSLRGIRSVQNQLKREPPTVLLICTLLVLHCSFILPHELEPLSQHCWFSAPPKTHAHQTTTSHTPLYHLRNEVVNFARALLG